MPIFKTFQVKPIYGVESNKKTVSKSVVKDIQENLRKKIVPLRYEMLDTPAEYLLMSEGRGTGKTIFMTQFLLYKSFDSVYIDKVFLCAREYQNSIEDSIKSSIEKEIYEFNIEEYFDIKEKHIVNKLTGVKFLFRGLQKPASIKSLTNLAIIAIEEGHNVKEKTLNIVEPVIRGLKEGKKIIVAMNRERVIEDIESFVGKQEEKDKLIHNYNILDLPQEYQDETLLKQYYVDKKDDKAVFMWKWHNAPAPDIPEEPFQNIIMLPSNEVIDYTKVQRLVAFMDPAFGYGDYTALSIIYTYKEYIYVEGFLFTQGHNECVEDIVEIFNSYPNPKAIDFYYEKNGVFDSVMNNFAKYKIRATPVGHYVPKIKRIAEVTGNNSIMNKLRFIGKPRNRIYLKELKRYNAVEANKQSSKITDDAPDSLRGALGIYVNSISNNVVIENIRTNKF